MKYIKYTLISLTVLTLFFSGTSFVFAKKDNEHREEKQDEKRENDREEKSQINIFEMLRKAVPAGLLNVPGTTTTYTSTTTTPTTHTPTTPTTPPASASTTTAPVATTTPPVATTTPVAGSTDTGLPIPTATPTSSFYEPTPAPVQSSEPAQPQSFFAGNYYGRAGFSDSITRMLQFLGFLSGVLGIGLVGSRALIARSL